ncbi:hypothetical protein KPE82_14060 [Acinetobacter baumannii]|uniref:hypothetical protein n=1 Tax=Acinetobacter baumannii TaxID=470 RepID=UPI001C0CA7C9|nr:hypothetical protein [Acinetobacter baumannii]MBU3096732.1 hypothetical protein [Acinetobacter baumannii]MDV7546423.1 hypothetical protein [Acinetobacter baumannii]
MTTLPYIELMQFDPDYDDEALFDLVQEDQVNQITVGFDDDSNRIYAFKDLNAQQRILALQAVDIMLDSLFSDEHFQEGEEQDRIYFDLQSMSLYASSGRKMNEITPA